VVPREASEDEGASVDGEVEGKVVEGKVVEGKVVEGGAVVEVEGVEEGHQKAINLSMASH
jgi:hypothetical protein